MTHRLLLAALALGVPAVPIENEGLFQGDMKLPQEHRLALREGNTTGKHWQSPVEYYMKVIQQPRQLNNSLPLKQAEEGSATISNSGDEISFGATCACDGCEATVTQKSANTYTVSVAQWKTGCLVHLQTSEPRKMKISTQETAPGSTIIARSVHASGLVIGETLKETFHSHVYLERFANLVKTFVYNVMDEEFTETLTVELGNNECHQVVSITGIYQGSLTLPDSTSTGLESCTYWFIGEGVHDIRVTIDAATNRNCRTAGALLTSWFNINMEADHRSEAACGGNLPLSYQDSYGVSAFIYHKNGGLNGAVIEFETVARDDTDGVEAP